MFFTKAFMMLFVVVNPVAVVPVFILLTSKFTEKQQKFIAIRSGLINFALLAFFAVIGDFILDALNISQAAFRITGGGLLLFLGIDLVRGTAGGDPGKETDAAEKTPESVAVYPLAIPFTAGPGAITTVVLLMHQAQGDLLMSGGVIGIIFAIALLTTVCFLIAGWLSRMMGETGIQILSRVFGIIVTGVSIQLVLDGLKMAFMTG